MIRKVSPELAKSIWKKLFKISFLLRNTSFNILEKDFHCTFAQFPIVQFFFTYPDATPTMKDLTSYIALSSSAVFQAVDELVKSSILDRIPLTKNHCSSTIRASEELRMVRNKAIDYFNKMLDAFKAGGFATPEEIALGDEIFVRLAESRTGGEIPLIKNSPDLSVPGLVKHILIDRNQLELLPSWILVLHFVTNLKVPTLIYYYETRGRMTHGKLRLLDYLFFLSQRGDNPLVKDIASRFQTSSGLVSQTLKAMTRDGVVECYISGRRFTRVRLTSQGLNLRRLSSASYTRFMQNFFSSFEQDKTELFDHILDHFILFLDTEGMSFLNPEGLLCRGTEQQIASALFVQEL